MLLLSGEVLSLTLTIHALMCTHLKTPIILQGYIEEKGVKGGKVDFSSHLQETDCPRQTGVVENGT